MKRKINKWLGWFDVYYAEMLLGVVFAIWHAILGDWSAALVWLSFSFSWGLFRLIISDENRRYKELAELARRIQENEENALKLKKWYQDELSIECQRHRLTAILLLKYKNKTYFMQRKKPLSEYLKYDSSVEDLYGNEVKRLQEMLKDFNNKRKEENGKEQDIETEAARAE